MPPQHREAIRRAPGWTPPLLLALLWFPGAVAPVAAGDLSLARSGSASECGPAGRQVASIDRVDYCYAEMVGGLNCNGLGGIAYHHPFLPHDLCVLFRIEEGKPGDPRSASTPKSGPAVSGRRSLAQVADDHYDAGDYGRAGDDYSAATRAAALDPQAGEDQFGYVKCMRTVMDVVNGDPLTSPASAAANCARFVRNPRVQSALARARIPVTTVGATPSPPTPSDRRREPIGGNCVTIERTETAIGCGPGQHWWFTSVKSSKAPGCPAGFSFTDREPDAPNGVSTGDVPTRLQTCGGPATDIRPYVEVFGK